MSRGLGFPTADLDVGMLDDPKVKALVRSCAGDDGLAARALVCYVATITSSWARGERIAVVDAAPAWITGLDDIARRLTDSRLLDGSGRIPQNAWDSWFRPARDRRTAKSEGGTLGAQITNQKRKERELAEIAERESREIAEREAARDAERDTRGIAAPPSIPSSPSDRPTEQVPPAVADKPTTRAHDVNGSEAVLGYEITCHDYVTHRNNHRKTRTGWLCDACFPAVVAGSSGAGSLIG